MTYGMRSPAASKDPDPQVLALAVADRPRTRGETLWVRASGTHPDTGEPAIIVVCSCNPHRGMYYTGTWEDRRIDADVNEHVRNGHDWGRKRRWWQR